MIAFIAILIIAGLFIYYRANAASKVSNHVSGPFVIRMEKFSTKNFNMNYGWVTEEYISYSVLHKGSIVQFPVALQFNTGFSHLWRAYILRDAPEPTILAGSQSLFKVKAKGDSYEVEALDVQTSDFIKFQWLDELEGQPGLAFELFMGNEQTPMDHPDTLAGGTYLMINQKMVIHVPTMEKFSFDKDLNHIVNYITDGDALAFSPDQSIITFPGYFQTWNSNEAPKYGNALISYDFKKDVKSVLPYSKNDTRLYRPENLNLPWFNTNFEWDTSGTVTQLKYKEREKPALWQGYIKEESYHLYPVSDTMLIIFKQFVLDYLKWPPEAVISETTQEYSGRVFRLGIGKSMFHLGGKEDEVTLSPDFYDPTDDSTSQLIKDIGKAFNEVLMTGKNQEHFTAIPENQTY